MTDRQRKVMAGLCFAVFLAFLVGCFWFIGRPLVRFVSEPEQFREWVDAHGMWGRLIFIGMMILQVFVAFIPGEPLEIGAGYAFGSLEGLLLCVAGIAVGSALVFLFVKKCGVRAVEVFFSREKIESFRWFQDTRRVKTLMFFLFFIPGTPKDILTYIAGLTNIRLHQFLLISTVARLPSIITSTIGGDALGIGNRWFAAAVFLLTMVLSGAGILAYHLIRRKKRGGGHELQ